MKFEVTININLTVQPSGEILKRLDAIQRSIEEKMSALSDAIADVKAGQADEARRVEAVITLLESNPSQAEVAQAIADLKDLRAAQDAERPDVPPTT